jgi:hypothetical protein
VDWSSIYICCSSIAGGLEQHLYLLFLYSWWTGTACIPVVSL